MKNIKNYGKLYRALRLDMKTRINGNISGGRKNKQPTIGISIFTKRYNLQNLSYGFGAPNAATN
jgi:hypothetical protein